MQYVDLRTGQRVDAPEEYDSNLIRQGEGIGPDHIEALRSAGEDEEVLRTLTSVGSPASYQAGPGEEIIPADDPRFPWDLLENHFSNRRRSLGAPGEEKIRTMTIKSPPNVYDNDEWWPFCFSEYIYPQGYTGNPRGVKWNPPTSHNYGGQYYVKGNYGNVYLWRCGHYENFKNRAQNWICCQYTWHDWDPAWTQKMGPRKWWPKYTCK